MQQGNDSFYWWVGQAIFLVSCGVAGYISVVQRISRVEVVIELLSDKAAKILHSPHTPEVDRYLDMLKNGELRAEHASDFIRLLNEVENDKDEPKGNRLAAALTHIKVARKFDLPIPAIREDFMLEKDK